MRVPDPEFEAVGPIVTTDDDLIIRMVEQAFRRAGQEFDLSAIEWRAATDESGDVSFCAWDGAFYYAGASGLHAVVDGKLVRK